MHKFEISEFSLCPNMLMSLKDADIKRYSRQLLVPQFGMAPQIAVSNARVLLVGAGGLGSSAAFYLAAAGIGTLNLVDGDLVERSNLHRQIIHTEAAADAKQFKVASAANALLALNSSCQVHPHPVYLTCDNAITFVKDVDVVVDGTDNVSTRYILSDACVLAGKPLVSGAAIGMDGQATVYNYQQRGACYRCRFPTPPSATRSCSDAGVLGPVPGLIGVLLAMEAIKIVAGVGTPLSERMYHYDALEGRSVVFQLPGRRPNCLSCGGCETKMNTNKTNDTCTNDTCTNDTNRHWTMEDTRRFLEEHRLSPKEETSSTQQQCTFDQTHQLSDEYCVSCIEYDEARLQYSLTKNTAAAAADNITNTNNNHILLDVRVSHQFEICALPGATNIPLAQLSARLDELREMEIIYVMCRRGIASVRATQLLLDAGFNNVRNIVGGLDAWQKEVDPSLPMY